MPRTLAPLALSALAAALPGAAGAQPVAVNVVVASVSNACKDVDPALKGMEQDFRQNGVSYTCYRLVNQASVRLAPGKPESVPLPNGQVTLTYVKPEGAGAIRLKVVSPGMSSDFTVGARAQIYLDAGVHAGGKVFLALRR
jgi:hypothetical protein